MKSRNSLLVSAAIIVGLVSCSKKDSTVITTPPIPVSNPISPGNISGFVKGTFTTGSTYTITADLTIKPGDTLASQPGVTVIVMNDAQIFVQGVLKIEGTKDKPVSFNSNTNTPGSWGGFQCDTMVASVTMKWANIQNTGGPDPSGGPRKSVAISSVVPCNVDIEDCWFSNGQDDLIRIESGAHISILRNTITCSGSTDGEAINLKTGVTGDVAYNVVYSQAGTGVKLETNDLKPIPQTDVNVYNNTFVSNGWRRGQAEPGRGVSVGVNARGNIFNNIFVNNYQGLEIFVDADTLATDTKYGNNLFYASVDTYTDTTQGASLAISIRGNFYPNDGVGKPQASDLISTAVGNMDPMFKSYDGKVATPNGAATSNDYHLNAGSPALGKGNSTYNNDIGAYTSDAKGNNH